MTQNFIQLILLINLLNWTGIIPWNHLVKSTSSVLTPPNAIDMIKSRAKVRRGLLPVEANALKDVAEAPLSKEEDVLEHSVTINAGEKDKSAYYDDAVEYFSLMLNHDYIGNRNDPAVWGRQPAISDLLKRADRVSRMETLETESEIQEGLSLTLQDIQHFRRDRWYKNQRVLSSWKIFQFEPLDKRLLVIIGEVVQIWAADFEASIQHWHPGFLVVWADKVMDTPLGVNKLTQSMKLKNFQMYNQALANSDARVVKRARAWFMLLMGQPEYEKRLSILAKGYSDVATAICDRLIEIFPTLENDLTGISEYSKIYKEITNAYPDIYKHFITRLRSTPKIPPDVSSRILHGIKAEIYSEEIRGILKTEEPEPVWSYREAVTGLKVLGRHPYVDSFFQTFQSIPCNKARIARLHSSVDRLEDMWIHLSKQILTKGDRSKSTLLELRWLVELTDRLGPEVNLKLQENLPFYLGMAPGEFVDSMEAARLQSSQIFNEKMANIFLGEKKHATSSQALKWLLELEYMKSCPIAYRQASKEIRSQMKESNRLDFDQKIEWLQKLSQPAMSEILTASHENLLELVIKPSFSSRSGLYHCLFDSKVQSMYEDNPAVLDSIHNEVLHKVGEKNMDKVKWIRTIAVRQTWVRDTWQSFVEGNLGYDPSDPTYHQIYALGKALQLEHDYPNFLGDSLQSSYQTLLSTSVEIKEYFQEISKKAYLERSRLLTVLAIEDIRRSSHVVDHQTNSILELVDGRQIEHWLRLGFLASQLIEAAKLLGLGRLEYHLPNDSLVSIFSKEGVLRYLNRIFEKKAREYQELSSLFKNTFHSLNDELDNRFLLLMEYLGA